MQGGNKDNLPSKRLYALPSLFLQGQTSGVFVNFFFEVSIL